MTSTRNVAAVLGAIAALLLFYLVNPWVNPEAGSTLNQIVTLGFWVSFIALLVILFQMRKDPGGETVEIEGPAFTRFLFGNSRAGLFWLPIRLFVGFAWLESGWGKFTNPAWVGLTPARPWQGSGSRRSRPPKVDARRSPTTGTAASSRLLLDNGAASWMSYVITFGELAVGIGAADRDADRHRRLLRGVHEHVLPAGRLGLDEPGPVHPGDRPDAGLEGRRLLRRRPLPAADARDTLAAGRDRRSRDATADRRPPAG